MTLRLRRPKALVVDMCYAGALAKNVETIQPGWDVTHVPSLYALYTGLLQYDQWVERTTSAQGIILGPGEHLEDTLPLPEGVYSPYNDVLLVSTYDALPSYEATMQTMGPDGKPVVESFQRVNETYTYQAPGEQGDTVTQDVLPLHQLAYVISRAKNNGLVMCLDFPFPETIAAQYDEQQIKESIREGIDYYDQWLGLTNTERLSRKYYYVKGPDRVYDNMAATIDAFCRDSKLNVARAMLLQDANLLRHEENWVIQSAATQQEALNQSSSAVAQVMDDDAFLARWNGGRKAWGYVVSVGAGKGGVAKSSDTIMLGTALANGSTIMYDRAIADYKLNVLIIDGDVNNAQLDIPTMVHNAFVTNLYTLEGDDPPSLEMIMSVLQQSPTTGTWVLNPPQKAENNEFLDARFYREALFPQLRRLFDIIIIDNGTNHINDPTLREAYVPESDWVYIASEPNPMAFRANRNYQTTLFDVLGHPTERTSIIFNRVPAEVVMEAAAMAAGFRPELQSEDKTAAIFPQVTQLFHTAMALIKPRLVFVDERIVEPTTKLANHVLENANPDYPKLSNEVVGAIKDYV